MRGQALNAPKKASKSFITNDNEFELKKNKPQEKTIFHW